LSELSELRHVFLLDENRRDHGRAALSASRAIADDRWPRCLVLPLRFHFGCIG